VSRLSYAAGRTADREPPRREVQAGSAQQARAMMDHVGWIVAAGVAGAAVGGVLALSMPQQYRAQALVQVESRDGAVRVAQSAQPATFDAGLLKSRAVVGPVVERLRLDITAEPLRAPLLGALIDRLATPGQPRGTWPESLGYAWGGERILVDSLAVPERLVDQPMTFEVQPDNRYRVSYQGTLLVEGVVGENAAGNGVELRVERIDAAPGTRFVLTRHDLARTADSVRRGLSVENESGEAGTSGTVRVAWQYPDRQLAADLVNGVTRAYITGQTAQRRDDAAGTLAFLSSELPRVQSELARAEEALARYRARTGSLQPSRDAQSFLNGSMEYQRQIAALRLERTRLLQRFTTDANEVRTVDSQIQQMTRERAEMDARMQSLSASERESVALSRDVKVAEDMYMTLRTKVEQLSLLQSDRSSQLRVVDSAIAPVTPVGFGTWPFMTGGALLGLCLGMAGVNLRQRLKPSVASAADAEQRLGMAMLGDIAHSTEQTELERQVEARRRFGIAAGLSMPSARLERPQPGTIVVEAVDAGAGGDEAARLEQLLRQGLHDQFLLARRAPHSLAVEGLRTLRAALHFSLRNAPNGVVAVTSAAAGAGKTFAAVNLAVLFAEAGQRVLLVDADLRRGKVADWFDQPAEPGLAEVLAGRMPIADAVRPTVVNGLFILTRGAPPPNPSELLMLPTLAESLRLCAGRFDLVIVDTPPVMAVADATLVANLAGSTLLVVRADVTPASQVDDALKRLAHANARLAGGILNGVIPRRSNRADFNSINPYLGMPLPAAQHKHPALTRAEAPRQS